MFGELLDYSPWIALVSTALIVLLAIFSLERVDETENKTRDADRAERILEVERKHEMDMKREEREHEMDVQEKERKHEMDVQEKERNELKAKRNHVREMLQTVLNSSLGDEAKLALIERLRRDQSDGTSDAEWNAIYCRKPIGLQA